MGEGAWEMGGEVREAGGDMHIFIPLLEILLGKLSSNLGEKYQCSSLDDSDLIWVKD